MDINVCFCAISVFYLSYQLQHLNSLNYIIISILVYA